MTLLVAIVCGANDEAMLLTDRLERPNDPRLGPRRDAVKSIRINADVAAGACGNAFYANAILARVVGWRLDPAADRHRTLNAIEAIGHDNPLLSYRDAKRSIDRHTPILRHVAQLNDGVEPTRLFLLGRDQGRPRLCVWQPAFGYRPQEFEGSSDDPEVLAHYPIAGRSSDHDASMRALVLDERRDWVERLKALLERCYEASHGRMTNVGHLRRLSRGFKLETLRSDRPRKKPQ